MRRNRITGTDEPKGQALVEFGLVLPIFLLILIGIFDVGRGIYAYNTASNAVRAALREAIVHQDADAVRQAAIKAGVALGLDDADITLNPCDTAGCMYGVTVTYDYEPATPLIGRVFDPVITASDAMPVETLNP